MLNKMPTSPGEDHHSKGPEEALHSCSGFLLLMRFTFTQSERWRIPISTFWKFSSAAKSITMVALIIKAAAL